MDSFIAGLAAKFGVSNSVRAFQQRPWRGEVVSVDQGSTLWTRKEPKAPPSVSSAHQPAPPFHRDKAAAIAVPTSYLAALSVPDLESVLQQMSEIQLLDVLNSAMESGQLGLLQRMVGGLKGRDLDSKQLSNMIEVFSPPKVSRSGRKLAAADIKSNRQWCAANAAEYQGRWVALVDGELLAVGYTLVELRAHLRDKMTEAAPLIQRMH